MNDILFNSVRALEPVLIHYLASVLISMISRSMGLHADAAFMTTITAVLVLPLFLYMLKKDRAVRKSGDEGKLLPWMYVVIPVIAVISNWFLSAAISALTAVMGNLFGLPVSNEVQEELLTGNLVIQLVGIGILVPVMEEVLFRGLVYNRFKDYNKEWLSVFLGALVFAVYHGNLIQILFAFPMALIITEVYRRGRTLKAPVLFHMAVNISSVLTAYMARISG